MSKDTGPSDPSRRHLFRLGGAAAAGAVLAGGGAAVGATLGTAAGYRAGFEAGTDNFANLSPRETPGLDHLVVVMGENRSFDNLLGYLYTPETLPEGKRFEGLAFGSYSNIGPDGTEYRAHVYEGSTDDIMGQPSPDPGEEFPHVNTQLFGTIEPIANAELWVEHMEHPYNAPTANQAPDNSGFVHDYYINYRRLQQGKEPAAEALNTIMGSFSPEMLPVLSTLAQEFAVFDHWFCAVPSQTFCNRSFFHASTSHGFVTNKHGGGYEKWIDAEQSPTIFNRLDDAGVDWRIYYDELQLLSFTGVLHAPVLEKFWKSEHFATMDQFYRDVENGTLPAYSFVEPRMAFNHNDFHPPFGKFHESSVEGMDVIDSAVSAYTARNTIVNDEMHHGSVIKTLCEQHGLKPLSRRDESANSLSLIVNLDKPRHPEDWPETRPQWLPENPQEAPPHPAHAHKDKPLSPPGRGLVGLVQARFGLRNVPEADTYAEAYMQLKTHGAGVMGVESV